MEKYLLIITLRGLFHTQGGGGVGVYANQVQESESEREIEFVYCKLMHVANCELHQRKLTLLMRYIL